MASHLLKTISLRQETYDRLRRLGHTPDSFDKLVTQLLDVHQARVGVEDGGAEIKVKC